MKQYKDLLDNVITNGIERTNRTQFKDYFVPSASMTHDLREGFPCITSKQVFYKQSIGEILGFLRGFENAKDFETLGCKFWFSDANENKTWLNSPFRKGENDLGKVYGSTWRKRRVFKTGYDSTLCIDSYMEANDFYLFADGQEDVYSKEIDQLSDVINTIINEPNNRRIMMHAWFPELFDEMALPPCHVMYKFTPDPKNKVLHMSMYQRSCDLLLGVPMNMFGSALLLELIAKATGYTAGVFTHFMSDVHLYENAIDQAKQQLSRDTHKLPTLKIKRAVGENPMKWLESVAPEDIELIGYKHSGKLDRVEMAQEK